MDAIGVSLLLVGALAIGIAGQAVRLLPRRNGWLIGSIAAAVGGFFGSELLGAANSWGRSLAGSSCYPPSSLERSSRE